MANEAVLIYETELPIPFTVANATGIEKGTLLKLTDPITAIAQSAANDPIAGIAAGEKIASDGLTKLEVYRGGIFKVTLSGSCTVGDALVSDAVANMVKTNPVPATLSMSHIVGYALETGTTGETILVEVRPRAVRNN